MITASQSPWRLIEQLTSSLFPLQGHLSMTRPSPPLWFHLGTATWTSLGVSPDGVRGPASESWLDGEGQAKPAAGA